MIDSGKCIRFTKVINDQCFVSSAAGALGPRLARPLDTHRARETRLQIYAPFTRARRGSPRRAPLLAAAGVQRGAPTRAPRIESRARRDVL